MTKSTFSCDGFCLATQAPQYVRLTYWFRKVDGRFYSPILPISGEFSDRQSALRGVSARQTASGNMDKGKIEIAARVFLYGISICVFPETIVSCRSPLSAGFLPGFPCLRLVVLLGGVGFHRAEYSDKGNSVW